MQETKLASKVESGESAEKNTELNKISAPHVIGSLPIAEYEGSPRRYGLRTTENIMPTLLSSPTVSFPRPGFPQVCTMISSRCAKDQHKRENRNRFTFEIANRIIKRVI